MVKGTVDQHFDKEICELLVVQSEHRFREFIQTNPTGLAMLPKEDIDSKKLQMHPHAWDFAKWLKARAPDIVVHVMPADEHMVLHSADIWLPLMYLANNVALPIHLNLVASYLYDKMKGALKNDVTRVHLSVVYEDSVSGVTKRFNFEGDVKALEKAIKKFDLNQFLDDQ